MSDLTKLRDIHHEGVNKHDIDLSASAFAPDVVTVTPQGEMQGLDALRQFLQAFADAVPDAKITADRTFEDGRAIVTEGIYSGTHTGDLVGPAGTVPATGRSFTIPFVAVMEAAGDKVTAHRIYWDMMGFMAQLGVLPE